MGEFLRLKKIITFFKKVTKYLLQYDLALDLGYSDSDLQGDPIKKAEAKAKVQQDYTRVDVYFQTLNVKSIVQSPTYPVSFNAT